MPKARGPLDLGGNKVTNVGNGSGSGDAAAFGQIPSSSSPLALAAGGTGAGSASGALAALNGAGKPASADSIVYVTRSGNDSGDGLSLGSAKATLAAAVTALGSGPGVIRMGAGTWTITSSVSVGIGLAVEGIPGATVITTTTANTPVFAVTANNVTLTGLTLTGPQYAAYHSAEKAVTVLGSSASSPVAGFTMRDCAISNWGYGGLYLQYVSGFTVERCTITDVLYAAVMVLSGAEGMIRGNLIDTVTGTGEPNCYGIALTRNDAAGTTLTTDPRTTEVTVTGNRVRNVTTWEGIDTHGGTDLDITGNQVYGCYRGIAINNCPDATGAAAFAPHNINVSGNIVDSTALGAGLADLGIVVQGASVTTGSPVECATGITVTGNTVTGCGLQGNNLSAAILLLVTYGAQVTGNTIFQPSPFGVMLYHDNYGVNVSGNTITDAWSSSYTLTSGIAVRAGWNTGFIGGNSYVKPGSLSATYLFVNGTYVTSGITNSSVALGANYCDSRITTPVSDVSGITYADARYAQFAGDLGNTAASPQVVSTHLTAALPIPQGGTGVQAASSIPWAGLREFPVALYPGADPSGATDSTAAVAAAKAAAVAAGGGIVSFGPGTWKFGTVTVAGVMVADAYIQPPLVHFRFAGPGATILTPLNASSPLFQVQSGTYAAGVRMLGGFTVKAHASGSTGPAIDLTNARQWVIESPGYLDSLEGAAGAPGTYNSVIGFGPYTFACHITDPVCEAQRLGNCFIGTENPSTVIANNNTIVNPLFEGNTAAYMIDGAGTAELNISGGIIEGNTVTASIRLGYATRVRGVHFESNVAYAMDAHGADIIDPGACWLENNIYNTGAGTLTIPSGVIAGTAFIGPLNDLSVTDNTASYLNITGSTLTAANSIGLRSPLLHSPALSATTSGTVTLDPKNGDYQRIRPTGNITVGSTTGDQGDGQDLTIEITQPASGGPYTAAWSSQFIFQGSAPAPALSTAASAVDLFAFRWNATASKWVERYRRLSYFTWTPVPSSAEAHFYVSAASGASDSNNGLSWGAPLASIARAITLLGGGPGIIELGAGTFTVSSPDSTQRTDTGCVTTSGSPTVTDSSALSSDAGAPVTGPGIPSGTVIVSASGGSFTMSANATASATVSLAIGGNAITLPAAHTTLKGQGWGLTEIAVTCPVTWGILLRGADSQVRQLTLYTGAGGSATYGVGVNTASSAGSCEGCHFTEVQSAPQYGVGTMTHAFAVGGAIWPGGAVDIAETVFTRCTSGIVSGAAFYLGNGVSGNILNTHMYGCDAGEQQWGVYANATNFTWNGGTVQHSSYADFWMDNCPSAVITGVRSENSARFLYCAAGPGGTVCTVSDVMAVALGGGGNTNTTGDWINYQGDGVLVLSSVLLASYIGSGIAPCLLMPGNHLAVIANGLECEAPLTQLFSAGATSNAVVILTGYVQINNATGYINSADPVIAGPVILVPTATGYSFNGVGRDVMLPQSALTSGVSTSLPAASLANLNQWYLATDTSVLSFSNGSAWTTIPTSPPTAPQVNWYNGTPGTFTWTRPAGAQTVYALAVGGGGGAGSGRTDIAGTVRCGGGGGAGSGASWAQFVASDLTSTVTVTVGAGGSGGAAVTGAATSGNNGTSATASSFGPYLYSSGGGRGFGGTASTGTAGVAGAGIYPGGAAGSASATGGAGNGTNASIGPGGGGSGGGITSADAVSNGGASAYSIQGNIANTAAGGIAGGAAPGGGTAITAHGIFGTGAGGGRVLHHRECPGRR